MPVAFSCLSQHTSKLNKVSTNYHHHQLLLLHQQHLYQTSKSFHRPQNFVFPQFWPFVFFCRLAPRFSLIRLDFDICSFVAFSRICRDMITLMHGHILTIDQQQTENSNFNENAWSPTRRRKTKATDIDFSGMENMVMACVTLQCTGEN